MARAQREVGTVVRRIICTASYLERITSPPRHPGERAAYRVGYGQSAVLVASGNVEHGPRARFGGYGFPLHRCWRAAKTSNRRMLRLKRILMAPGERGSFHWRKGGGVGAREGAGKVGGRRNRRLVLWTGLIKQGDMGCDEEEGAGR
jgi:hypothetical protein